MNQKPSNRFGTADGWYSVWILVTVYINSIDLGMLQSLKISPQMQTVSTSFHEIVQAGFAFYSYPGNVRPYDESFLGKDAEFYMGVMSKNDFDDLALLTSLLEPMPLEIMTRRSS